MEQGRTKIELFLEGLCGPWTVHFGSWWGHSTLTELWVKQYQKASGWATRGKRKTDLRKERKRKFYLKLVFSIIYVDILLLSWNTPTQHWNNNRSLSILKIFIILCNNYKELKRNVSNVILLFRNNTFCYVFRFS